MLFEYVPHGHHPRDATAAKEALARQRFPQHDASTKDIRAPVEQGT